MVTNESNAMTERSEMSETGTGEEVGWEPALSWVPAFGVEQANQLEWPKLPELKKLNLANTMKLNSIDIGTTSNLYEIHLNFSNGTSSSILRTPYAGEEHETNKNLRNFPIDMKKRIADVYINQSETDGSIYGLRFADDKGEFIINENWFSKAG